MFKKLSGCAVLYRVSHTKYAAACDEYGDSIGDGRVALNTHLFEIVGYTAQGAWIDNYGEAKFVNLRATKQFASASLAEAQEAFRQRKRAQTRILQSHLSDIRQALYLLDQKERL